ncbi:hypothetical protein GLAREA_06914 [Glarea lozoyensis ATCC 20868]|uniref:Uncharacterized protein n=1 Tax=Glarea lozoyensis (strain ATCC 20868 / MF5171) TaxID=1116229 RepID=S3DP78_GLAL2|nr:uncharacterized protein GLAREA_06914 [Glarea lozoyensis ATCC 20868]EPE33901.1 hypothetical protein GLAREA_06914 [Glarea lozoyensis ATCC 20868]
MPKDDDQLPRVSALRGVSIAQCTRSRRKERTRGLYPYSPPPYRLLQTLLKRPDLAQYIKEVELLMVTPDTGVFHDRYDAREGGLSRVELLTPDYDISGEIPFHFILRTLSGLRAGQLEAYMAVLLTLLTNVRTVNFRLRGPVVNHLMMKALVYRPGRSMKTLKFTTDSTSGSGTRNFGPWLKWHRIDAALPSILSLPGIESLYVEELVCLTTTFEFSLLASSTLFSTLKRLSLPRSNITELHVGSLLMAMPKLEHFECLLAYDQSDNERCHGEVLSLALSFVAETLVSLSLGIDILRPQPTLWQVAKPLGSLKNFKKLETLHIPIALLITPENVDDISEIDEILPPNLVSFTPNWRDPRVATSALHYETTRMVKIYYAKRSWPLFDAPKY